MITTQRGRVLTSKHPTSGHWRARSVVGGVRGRGEYEFFPTACASRRLCLVATGVPLGLIYASTNPTGGSRAWTRRSPAAFPKKAFTGASCVSTRFCAVAANDGTVYSSTRPSARHGWKASHTDRSPNRNVHISCATARFCVIDRNDGKLFVGRR